MENGPALGLSRARRPAAALMVVGTCSSAGKSTLVTALCRLFARRGLLVAPFKSQNMSLNSAVTPEGHEIGRSTYSQAEAAGAVPHVDMNPVLLKPEGEKSSQVVLAGRASGRLEAREWSSRKPEFWGAITAALDRLRARFDLVILEGAGSPAEINLPQDLANLRVARHAGAPAVLVGDIDRGGVFASLVGTMTLLSPEERSLVRGFVINKLRGDASLLGDGPERLRQLAFGVPTLGVIPFLPDLGLAEEDSVALGDADTGPAREGELDLAVLRWPRLANFDDFDALAAEPGVRVRFVHRARDLGTPAAVILPGSKNTISDLEWLRRNGFGPALHTLAQRGIPLVGLCGGYQMLGEHLADPQGIEGTPGREARGLGLLPLRTRFAAQKTTRQVSARCLEGLPGPLGSLGGLGVRGYEIHMGEAEVSAAPALFEIGQGGVDGCASASGLVWGSYLHGLFTADDFRHAWLRTLGWEGPGESFDRDPAYDRLADHVERHLDMAAIEALVEDGS